MSRAEFPGEPEPPPAVGFTPRKQVSMLEFCGNILASGALSGAPVTLPAAVESFAVAGSEVFVPIFFPTGDAQWQQSMKK